MKLHPQKILFVAFVIIQFEAFAQQKEIGIQKYSPKKFISKVAIIGGTALLLPYEDSGYADSFRHDYNTMGINATFQIKNKFGTLAGLAVFHSLGKRWEIEGRLMYEEKGYIQVKDVDRPGDYTKTQFDIKNNYLTFSLIPHVAVGSKNKFFLYSGFLYNYILHSMSVDTYYVNGVRTNLSTTQYTNSSGGKTKFNGSVLAGAGYLANMSKKIQLCIQLQCNYGVGNIEEFRSSSGSFIMKSNGICLLTGFRFKR